LHETCPSSSKPDCQKSINKKKSLNFCQKSLSQEAEEEGKVFPRLSEISQGAEAEGEISQIMSEISHEGEAEE
jgi:iron-sulfur cluster repair protein YtfE (RIC family)